MPKIGRFLWSAIKPEGDIELISVCVLKIKPGWRLIMRSFWIALEYKNKGCSHLKLSILQKVGAPAAQVALVGLGLLIGNPLTCALFKQQSEISGGSLEPELNLDPRIKAFYNKGLWNKRSKKYKRSGELLIICLLFYSLLVFLIISVLFYCCFAWLV